MDVSCSLGQETLGPVAELADALDSGSSGGKPRGGSTPLRPTVTKSRARTNFGPGTTIPLRDITGFPVSFQVRKRALKKGCVTCHVPPLVSIGNREVVLPLQHCKSRWTSTAVNVLGTLRSSGGGIHLSALLEDISIDVR